MAQLDHTIYNGLKANRADSIMASGNALKQQKQGIEQNRQVLEKGQKELDNYEQNRNIELNKEKHDYFVRALPMVVDQITYDSMLDEVDTLFPDADRSKMPVEYTDELGEKLRKQFGIVKTSSPYSFLNTDEGVVRGNKETGAYEYVSGGGTGGGTSPQAGTENPNTTANMPDVYQPWANTPSKKVRTDIQKEAWKRGDAEITRLKENLENVSSMANQSKEFLSLQETQNPNWFVQNFLLFSDALAGYDEELGRMDSITSYLTPRMRAVGSGASSDFEQKMYRRSTMDRKKNQGTNRAIAEANIALEQREIARIQFFEQYLAANKHLQGAQPVWNAYMEDQPLFLPNATYNDKRMSFYEWVKDSGINPYRPQSLNGRKKYYPSVNERGWKLMTDANGIKAYVSETGEYEQVD